MSTLKTAITALSLVSLGLHACNSNNPSTATPVSTPTTASTFEIIGKSATLVYPDFTAEVSYLTDSTLHWKTTDPKGVINEGDEQISYKKVNEGQFFLNWIEKDGLSVSQVLDAKNGTVVAFITYADETSKRGKRAASFTEGTFKLK